MLNATMHAIRLNAMTGLHQSAFNALSTTVGRTLVIVANSLGLSTDAMEKLLGAVVDEGLASRSVGQRDVALYTAL